MGRPQALSGILLGLAAYALYSVGDAAVRNMSGRLPAFEVALIGAIVSLVLAPVVLRGGNFPLSLVRPKRWSSWALRGLFAVGGTVFGIVAWSRLPLAQAASIMFLNPLLTTALSAVCLGEKVSTREWLAVSAGFAGVLLVLRPGLRELDFGYFAAIACALCGTFTNILLHATREQETPASMYGAACLSVVAVGAFGLTWGAVLPAVTDWPSLLAYTVCGAAAGLLLLFAWRRGRAASVAPTQYSQEVWAILLGLAFFAEVPDVFTVSGAFLIVVAGLAPHLESLVRAGRRES